VAGGLTLRQLTELLKEHGSYDAAIEAHPEVADELRSAQRHTDRMSKQLSPAFTRVSATSRLVAQNNVHAMMGVSQLLRRSDALRQVAGVSQMFAASKIFQQTTLASQVAGLSQATAGIRRALPDWRALTAATPALRSNALHDHVAPLGRMREWLKGAARQLEEARRERRARRARERERRNARRADSRYLREHKDAITDRRVQLEILAVQLGCPPIVLARAQLLELETEAREKAHIAQSRPGPAPKPILMEESLMVWGFRHRSSRAIDNSIGISRHRLTEVLRYLEGPDSTS
jgi:hypothetical protein